MMEALIKRLLANALKKVLSSVPLFLKTPINREECWLGCHELNPKRDG